MKLKAIHLFIILLGALIFSHSLGGFMEGFEGNKDDKEKKDKKNKKDDDKDSASTASNNTNTFISDLESEFNMNQPKKHNKQKKHTDDNGDVYDYTNDSYTGPAGDKVIVGPTPPSSSSSSSYSSSSSSKKHNYMPLGIPRSQIPSGSEDLYILKSEVIPPVCPACPSVSSCPSKDPPPPCPPCARCPEPAFDCKKVPNYNNTNNSYLPIPILSDFSQFGM